MLPAPQHRDKGGVAYSSGLHWPEVSRGCSTAGLSTGTCLPAPGPAWLLAPGKRAAGALPAAGGSASRYQAKAAFQHGQKH